MSRASRLLQLLQILRLHRYPVAGEVLAGELGISLRTLYRDMDALRLQGADIEAEAGVGFVLRPGFMLPPLMLSLDEIEALTLGAQLLSHRADKGLGEAALNALSKISAVLPDDVREGLVNSGLVIPEYLVNTLRPHPQEDAHLLQIRNAIRKERKLTITYSDIKDEVSQRVVWPIAIGFFERTRLLVSFCELRQDFRHFRADRIVALALSDERYPARRFHLLRQWRDQEAKTGESYAMSMLT